ncbi:glycosyltransferase family 1 protein [Calidifontibacillus erzurumensis]|uniref:Glycosyltransferase family 1 protein n=1 Tax=Calidifontibacillus erzurumensis TaxID=2741433 RepID=A0A8J8KD75_9BACI|nr:glycosyltransferase family 1 protein [Calidifontibacillus erzurumensis]NSL52733.1 glycosyltransferase family 1 protein [Calidifontibacillus erzurumensis]
MSKPIRILQVFANMNRGGAETMIMNLYRNIDRSNIQFDFIVHTEDHCAYDDEIHELGGRIFRIPSYKGKNHLLYKKKWYHFFKNHPEYKIIHGHVVSTGSIYLKIAKKFGLVTIAHSHSTSSGSGFPSVVKNVLQFPLRYIADYLFACSYAAGEWLFGKRACEQDNFYLMKNAIEAKQFIFNENIRQIKRKEFQIEDKFVIGHVGRFNTPKNHSFLIDVFKEVCELNQNAVLMLVGNGDLHPVIEKKVNKLGLTDRVIFTGVRSDIPELLQAMDVFLFPSLYEGLPVTLVEAQATGLRCIISDRITNEVIVTDLVEQLSLDLSAKHWSKEVLKYMNSYERKSTFEEIKVSGYDISDTAKWLELFYISKI